MQQLQDATISAVSPEQCARRLMEVIPLVMRQLRGSMRQQSMQAHGLTIAHFRTLLLLGRVKSSPLTEVAAHLGLSGPAASRMVQNLVSRGWVVRQPGIEDRRQISLRLSERGRAVLKSAQRAGESRLAEALNRLSPEQRAEISQAMDILSEAFGEAEAGAN
jgi:DNA-binding MarR family transcriptional regulator